jgi:inner membrane protein
MDPLTHTATGWLLSQAGFRRSVPQAPWLLMLAANAPDIDIVTSAGGALAYLNHHRHLTHSLFAMPLMAALPVLAARLLSRKRLDWKAAYGISLAAVASHVALDWTNIYGVRLLLPFSARWFRLDLTSVIDPWLWAVFLLCLLGPLLARLVSQEIGAPNSRNSAGRGFAIFGLIFLALYNGGHAILHRRAVETLDARLYEGAEPQRVAALPDPFRPFLWHGLVETPGFYGLVDVNLLGEFDPGRTTILYKPEETPAIAAARRAPAIQDFLRFSQFPFWRVLPATEPENGTLVEVMDLRFGTPRHPAFVASAVLSARLEVLRSWFTFGQARPK